ncbi:MAG: glycosyltransferase family 4 protein [Patescibacteria group bacterium]|nr:glycosyltransferase family 4 protein [Patescibacteria group bacterium]
MLNVLMIGWELPPFNSGGLGVASYYLALSLSQKTNLFFFLPYYLNLKNIPFKVIFADSELKKIINPYVIFKFPLPFDLLNQVLTYGQRILQKIKESNTNPDIIHAHDWLGGIAGVYLKEKLAKPLIIHIHSTEIERTGNNPNKIIYDLEKKCFEKADKLIAVSNLTKKIIKDFYFINEDKIEVVPNGISFDKQKFKIIKFIEDLKKENYKIVLFVGRLVLQKGPDYFLQTLKYVKNYIPKIKYIFAGSGEMMNDLIKIAYQENVIDNIIFAGFLREEELSGVYQFSDLLVAPSVFDPFGLVPLEAIKFKKPIIISKTTGVGEFLNHYLSTDYCDVKLMANYIVSLLSYSPLKNEIVRNSYKELIKFNWEERAEKILNIYQNLVYKN